MPVRLLRTLRFRLTLWNTVAVFIASVFALIAVREAMRLTIENEARSLLREEAIELELAINQLYPDQNRINDEFKRKVLGHSQHEWFAALLDSDQKPIWTSENFAVQPGSFLRSVGQPQQSSTVEKIGNRLIVSHAVTLPDNSQRVIVIGEPTHFIQNDLWQLTRVMLYIGAVLLVVAPVGGYILARRATSPVRAIIATTRSLDPAHLDSRLPIRGTKDELDQISTEINSFVDQIARYIDSQREFVANAAHELRSPLTAIQTSAEVCLTKTRTIDEYQEELETVSEQCQFLRHLVNQLLELAESDTGLKINKVEFDFSELVRKSLAIFTGVAEEKSIRIVACVPPNIRCVGDPNKLIQVLNNLIDNSIKFTPPGGAIDLELDSRDQQIYFRISDDGPGVPVDKLARIFERFFRMNPSSNSDNVTGNGLGLSICESIVQTHNGRITASKNGRFTIQFQIPISNVTQPI